MKVELKHEGESKRDGIFGPLFIDGKPCSKKPVKPNADGFWPFDPTNEEPWFNEKQARAVAVALGASFTIV